MAMPGTLWKFAARQAETDDYYLTWARKILHLRQKPEPE